MTAQDYNRKRIVLIMVGKTETAEDDWALFFGKALFEQGRLYLDRGSDARFEIQPEWIDRIEPVMDSARGVLGEADYALILAIGNLPGDAKDSDFIETGLRWPAGDDSPVNNERGRARRIKAEIASILLHDWDPIGIRDEPAASDEYDAYVGSVYQLLMRKATVEQIAAHLAQIQTDQIGIAATRESLVAVAQRLVALK